MADVEEPVQNGVDEDHFVDAEEGEEQDSVIVKKSVDAEGEEAGEEEQFDDAPEEPPADEDRTEDQVDDIPGTETVDPMTTSMDDIEELPTAEEAPQDETTEDAVPDQLENQEDGEIPVEVMEEEAAEEPPAEEAEPVAEEEPEEPPAEEEEPPAEEPEEAKEEAEEEPAPEPEPEEPAEEPQEEAPAEEAPAEEVPAEEPEFVLQSPPPGRTRTPNELDNPPQEEEEAAEPPAEEAPGTPAAGSVPATPRSKKSSAPGTPRSTVAAEEEAPATPKAPSAVGSAPGTPKAPSAAGSVPPTPRTPVADEAPVEEEAPPATPRSARGSAVGSVPGTPKSKASAAGSVPQTPKAEGSAPATPKENGVATPPAGTPRTPKSGAATGTPRSKKAFDFENEAAATTPRTPKKTTFADEEALVTPAAKTPKTPRTPRTPKTPKTPKTPAAEPEPEPPAEEANGEEPPPEEKPEDEAPVVDEERERIRMMEKWAGVEGEPPKTPATDAEAPAAEEPAAEEAEKAAGDEEEAAPRTPVRARRESPSPPPRAAREPREYVPYDEGLKESSGPVRLPDTGSFSSWVAPEKVGYQALSPLAQNAVRKYQNEYTSGSTYRPPTTYTQIFDDIVNTGAFGQNLYATNRLLERSRSRTRERRSALRGHRSASNYARFSSQYPSALRTSEYATPRSASVSRAPSRSGSFVSFMDYAGSKQYDLARSDSRGLLYGATEALSRSSSRGDIPYWTGSGRISRVDSFVNNMNSRYEWNVPSTYDMYRSSSRSNLYANGYAGQAADLQRTLSKERYEKDRLRSSYAQVAYKLDQALKQIDLLRTNSYSNLRSSSLPRTSVYTHFYPYY